MDQDLIAYLDERFRETAKHIDSLRQETTEQISSLRQETAERFEAVEGAIRQTHVAVEGLRGDLQLIAEGMIGMEEKAQAFRNQSTSQFEEVRKSIEPYFRQLDRRVNLLEERAAREGQAPMDIIRERFGKKAG
jgi:predicted  nucleic acid-binding Zn-ribbon protein